VDALGSAGLLDLQEAAGRPEARPSAAQLLPGTTLSEGIPRLERLLLSAAREAPHQLDGAAAALVGAGGKRVRPLLALLSARAAHPGRRSRGRVALAVAAELIHSATLLHDDVIDDGLTRRGLPAPRVAYGNSVSVLAGDWLLTTSLDLALRSRVPGAVEALVRTLRELVAGEARQLSLRGSTDFTPDDALAVGRLKTGSLFAFCGEAGALAARASKKVVSSLHAFGGHAGTAFQISDDLLDFEADAHTLGKAVLADVSEGKPSLPLALALQRLPALRAELSGLLSESKEVERTLRARELLSPPIAQGKTGAEGAGAPSGRPGAEAPGALGIAKGGGPPEAEALRGRCRAFATRLAHTGSLGTARRVAEQERDAALAALEFVPASPTRDLLGQVATLLLERTR
jgi:octaprenyl-diphosphate synthase